MPRAHVEGKAVFFTGATGGLGACCVRRLAERGYAVFAGGTRPDMLEALGAIPRVVPVRADVTDIESLRAARRTVLERTDSLAAIVNFAGVTAFTSLIEGDPVGLTERLLDINVLGTLRANFVFFDLVERGRGRIVNCSSSAGWMTAQPFVGPYALSKRAVEAYNDSLRRELMFLGVPVVKIQPGSFRTQLSGDVEEGYRKTLRDTSRYARLLPRMKPLMDAVFRRSGDPEAVADVVLRALEAKRPRAQYRVGSGLLLSLLELLPEAGVDRVYTLLYKERKTERPL